MALMPGGDYNSSSDVDVMILVKMSDNEIKKIENQVYDLAFVQQWIQELIFRQL